MFGVGLLKGLGVTMKHFVETYIDDLKAIPSRYAAGQDFLRQTPEEEGLFTIQYPEEKRQLPERFRYIPMLIYDTPKGEDRCTACGICAKVCPPQCIWIVRDKDEKGKPIPRAGEFYIDASICMSCGFCSEFCPFDAIKMNHDYELAVYQRYPNLVYNMQELTVPLEYYAALYPTQFVEEEKRRAEEEAKKAKKPAAKAAPVAAAAAAKARTSTTLSPEELEKRRAEAKARAAARKAAAGEAPAAEAEPSAKPLPATARTSTTLSPEELERRRAEAKARVAARKGEAAEQTEPKTVEPAPPQAQEPKPAPKTAPTAAVAATAGYGKPQLAAAKHTSGTLSYQELEARRAAGYARYQGRKGADAKVLHAAAAQPVPEPSASAAEAPVAVEEPVAAVAQTVETPVQEPEPPQEAAPEAAVPAEMVTGGAEAGRYGKRNLASAQRTSGTLGYEELEERRAACYARYRARKGPDAKDLGH